MRIRSLTSLALIIGATLCNQAQASGDDSCYPVWSLLKTDLDQCSNLPFLSPGNDSRINLRLLLADRKALPLSPNALSEQEQSEGFGAVPFAVRRLSAPDETSPDASASDAATPESGASAESPLNGLIEKLGLPPVTGEKAGDAFLQGEGSRCRSNSDASAVTFVQQLLGTPELTEPERQSLARSRLAMLGACGWDPQQQASVLPADIQSPMGLQFVAYLAAAGDFYSGRFQDAARGFESLAASAQPWLKEVATYMLARTALNDGQQQAFDEYGTRTPEQLDRPTLKHAEDAFMHYLTLYPQGAYSVSAKGLLRRVHWLAGDDDKLADDYVWQLTQAQDTQRNVSRDELVQEVDNKLLTQTPKARSTPLLAAVNDLMWMREQNPSRLTAEQLQAQQATFADQPALFTYLQAAFAFYVEKNPENALRLLPDSLPESLDYLTLSQQTLRGLALEARHDLPGAQALWLKLLPLARQPLQHEQLELALALNLERSGQLDKVFASDSPIRSAQLRAILLGKVAGAPLLRQQVEQGLSDSEKNTALFVLLYKDLFRGQFADFATDLKRPAVGSSEQPLGSSLGYVYDSGRSVNLFQWKGDKAESGYACPSIGETAATLQANARDPHGLNCLGEFILRNGLDSMPLDQRPAADTLGGSAPLFKGDVFSRLNGYQQVIADSKAPANDKAYALYRAINCYGPSGYNSCGGKDVAPAVRKAWFKQLKTTYAKTQWGQSLKIYW